MLKKNQRYFNWINRLLDMAIIYLSYLLAVWFWFFYMGNDKNNIALAIARNHGLLLLIISFAYVVVFQYAGMYDSKRFARFRFEIAKLFRCFVLCTAMAVGAIFILKLSDFSRGAVVCYGVIAFTGLCVKRILVRGVLRAMRKDGYNRKHMLLVGSGELAEKYADCIKRNPHFGCVCIGYVSDELNPALGKCFGGYAALGEVLEHFSPDEVIIAVEQYEVSLIKKVIAVCEEQGIRTSIIPIYNDFLPSSATVDVIENMRLINLRTNLQDIVFNRALKRAFDVVFSFVIIVLTSPVMLAAALGVWLSSPGPVIFRQERIGKERKPFVMYKFRSMRLNTESDTAWSTNKDPRVTAFGAFIRKFSIDELPQFFNVLKGDMSVVGPRPELPHYVERYKYEIPRYMVKHQVKPGITGWAQVNGYRGDTSIEKRVEYDLWYIENWSFGIDIKIILMTVFGGMINKENNLILNEKIHKETV